MQRSLARGLLRDLICYQTLCDWFWMVHLRFSILIFICCAVISQILQMNLANPGGLLLIACKIRMATNQWNFWVLNCNWTFFYFLQTSFQFYGNLQLNYSKFSLHWIPPRHSWTSNFDWLSTRQYWCNKYFKAWNSSETLEKHICWFIFLYMSRKRKVFVHTAVKIFKVHIYCLNFLCFTNYLLVCIN